MYDFIPNPLENIPFISKCEFEYGGSMDFIGEITWRVSRGFIVFRLTGSANISSEHLNHSRTHDVPVDCTWIIRAEEGKHIYLQFPEYDLQMPNDCNYNFIQIFDGKTDIEHRKRNLCGSVADNYVSETDILYVR